MLRSMIKRFICGHNQTILVDVKGQGKDTIFTEKCLCCGRTLIDNIKTRYGKWCDAYIIGGYALKSDRERLQQLLNAELIYCEATKEECYNKVSELNLNDNWYKYIDKWFDSYIE